MNRKSLYLVTGKSSTGYHSSVLYVTACDMKEAEEEANGFWIANKHNFSVTEVKLMAKSDRFINVFKPIF